MSWIFIVIRDNTIEQVKVYKDYWEGAAFTDTFIRRVEPGLLDLPDYNRAEFYRNDNLTIGLYKDQ